jgi:cytoskeletal protein CcmA (bactofilin family)
MLSKAKEREASGRPDAAAVATDDVSFISSDMKITGECSTQGALRIEGRIHGNIAATGVELAPSGQVEGDVVAIGPNGAKPFVIGGAVTGAVRAGRVEVRRGGSVSGGIVADEAVIHGRVAGGVQARSRLALEESAEVEGDVLARRLALKEGGRVNGNIRMGDDVLSPARSTP